MAKRYTDEQCANSHNSKWLKIKGIIELQARKPIPFLTG